MTASMKARGWLASVLAALLSSGLGTATAQEGSAGEGAGVGGSAGGAADPGAPAEDAASGDEAPADTATDPSAADPSATDPTSAADPASATDPATAGSPDAAAGGVEAGAAAAEDPSVDDAKEPEEVDGIGLRWIDLHAPSLSGLGGFGHLITPDAMKGIRAGAQLVYSESDSDRRGLTLEGEHASWELCGAFGFGIGEVAVRVPVYERRRDDSNLGDQVDEESFGDIELSAKVGVPLGYAAIGGYLRLDLPTGDDSEGLGAMREPFPARQSNEAFGAELELGGTFALRLFQDGEFAKVSLLANLGVSWAEGAELTFLYRLGLSYAATDGLRFVAYWDGEEHESVVEHRGSLTLGVQGSVAQAALVTVGLTVLADDEFAQGIGLDDVKQLGIFIGLGAAF